MWYLDRQSNGSVLYWDTSNFLVIKYDHITLLFRNFNDWRFHSGWITSQLSAWWSSTDVPLVQILQSCWHWISSTPSLCINLCSHCLTNASYDSIPLATGEHVFLVTTARTQRSLPLTSSRTVTYMSPLCDFNFARVPNVLSMERQINLNQFLIV